MISACFLLLSGLAEDEGAAAPPLGSPGYRPSLTRPFGWRGEGTGRFPGATPPTEWSPAKNVRWSAVVGRSYSSPVLAGTLVVVASEPDLLLALDTADGRERWRVRTRAADLADAKDRDAAAAYARKDTGLTAATPVTDGTRLYAVFANGIVRAVDLAGRPQWTVSIDAEETTKYGRSASPVIVGGRLIVHLTHLCALDPETGRTVWVNRSARSNYGTPAGLRVGDADLIVTPAGDVVDAADGRSLNDAIGASASPSPVVQGGRVYFGDQDVKAVRLGPSFKDEVLWTAGIPHEVYGSPLLHGGLLFTASVRGDLYVFDAEGKGPAEPAVEARELFSPDGVSGPVVYSSFTLGGRYLYLASLHGEVAVLEATREARPVARNRLKDGSGASPVFSGSSLYLRDGERLYRVGE
jgi:outer membrane protein assembly factor BamB